MKPNLIQNKNNVETHNTDANNTNNNFLNNLQQKNQQFQNEQKKEEEFNKTINDLFDDYFISCIRTWILNKKPEFKNNKAIYSFYFGHKSDKNEFIILSSFDIFIHKYINSYNYVINYKDNYYQKKFSVIFEHIDQKKFERELQKHFGKNIEVDFYFDYDFGIFTGELIVKIDV